MTTPSSPAILVIAPSMDEEYEGLDTRRMRVASSGQRKMSAMNSAAADAPR